ncbi:MAG: hypothetical protein ABIW38_15650 [Ferruginibacter sp.]
MNLSLLKNQALLIVIPGLLLSACNNGKDKEVTATNSTSDSSIVMPTPPTTYGLSTGMLDTLWITAAEFANLDKNKANFIFYFGTMDTITVHGWKDKGGPTPFNATPDVKLIKGKKDATLSYGPGTYFGNLVLLDVNKLQKLIQDSAYNFVIFAPKKLSSHVYYKVYLSKEAHTLDYKTMAIVPSGDDANPSPPKL